jgi:hypothetical protein
VSAAGLNNRQLGVSRGWIALDNVVPGVTHAGRSIAVHAYGVDGRTAIAIGGLPAWKRWTSLPRKTSRVARLRSGRGRRSSKDLLTSFGPTAGRLSAEFLSPSDTAEPRPSRCRGLPGCVRRLGAIRCRHWCVRHGAMCGRVGRPQCASNLLDGAREWRRASHRLPSRTGERRRLCGSDERLHVTQLNNHVPEAWTC